MRELTPEECEFIAGGTYNGEYGTPPPPIVVIASPPYYPPPPPPPYLPPAPTYGGGGGGYSPTPPPPPPTDDYCADQEAMQADDEIEDMPYDGTKEYGSLVYRLGNQVLHSPPIPGGFDGRLDPQKLFDWMAQNNVSFGQIVGFVHNHPSGLYGTTSAMQDVNRYPSGGNNSSTPNGDWDVADYFVNHGTVANDFSLYIVDTAGVLREFKYSDKSLYEPLTDVQMRANANLPSATTACGS